MTPVTNVRTVNCMSRAELEESIDADLCEVGADHSRGLVLPLPTGRSSDWGLTISSVSSAGSTIVRPVGELDLSTVRLLEEALLDELGRGARHLVLDLRRLEFCDAAGLQALLRVRRRALASGARLLLERPTRTVRRVLEITRLDWLIADSNPGERVPPLGLAPPPLR